MDNTRWLHPNERVNYLRDLHLNNGNGHLSIFGMRNQLKSDKVTFKNLDKIVTKLSSNCMQCLLKLPLEKPNKT